ncbi:MAG: PrsW family intramembrane metalloprotease [Bacilli bacterium]|nr:PrsW family intramembrane metalloprotease [Bacilli bacterium]
MDFLSFVVAILPVFLIGLYIYKNDTDKESSKFLFKMFMYGILSCFPAAFLSLFIGNFFPAEGDMNFIQMFLYVFISIALVEEFCKWILLYKGSYNHSEFDTLYDMIVYASFVSLGFACFENILYVSDSGIATGLIRAVTAVPGHVCDGILMGSYLALAKINMVRGNRKLSNKYMTLSLFIPVLTHGIYDFCLFWGSYLFVAIFSIFVIILYIICIKKVKQYSNNDLKFRYKNKYCPYCGTLVNSSYCPKCGNKNN